VNVGYHGVDEVPPADDPENLCIAPARFRAQIELLQRAGFELVTVAELAERAGGGEPPPGLASVSFDDGLEDNHRVALPILRELGVRATVYVTTGFIGRPNEWIGRPGRYMTEDELRDLARAGFELGAHSVTHPDLSALGRDDCRREVRESVAAVEAIAGAPVRTFAYPFCRYGDDAVAAVREAGLVAAVTCEGRGDWSPYTMKRALITGKDGPVSFVAKLWGAYQGAFASPPGRAFRAATRGPRERRRGTRGVAEPGAAEPAPPRADPAPAAPPLVAGDALAEARDDALDLAVGPPAPVEGGSERAFARAARNTAARAAGELLAKLASLGFYAVLARKLDQSGVGVFVFALAWAEISMLLASLGLDRALVLWIARDRSRAPSLFADAAAIKAALAVPIALVSFALVNVIAIGSTSRTTIYVLTLGALFDALTRVVVGVYTALEHAELTAASTIAQRFLAAGLGIGVLVAGGGVVAASATYTGAAAVGFALAVVLMRRRLRVARSAPDPSRWRGLAARSVPFAVQDTFTVLLFRLDAVLLSLIASDAAVGRYGSSYRLFESTFFLTYALGAAFSPMYAYLERDSEPTIQAAFQRSLKLSLLLLVPCAVVFGTLPEFVSRTIFGSHLEAASASLRILAPVVVLIGLVTLSTSLIVSRRDPRTILVMSGAMTLLNVGLNLAFIPGLEERGAATAMLGTEAVFLVLALAMAVRTLGTGLDWVSMCAAPLVAGAAMAGLTLALRDSPALALVAGAALYPLVFAVAERLISPGDLAFVTGFLRGRLGWGPRRG
jgi:O-antigen/teichoic acid export membrane protein/peptidoglycan/xylan/chitin deacetylase (PgdA/CDA1 family)